MADNGTGGEGTSGRLGRLFAALVGGAAEVDLSDGPARVSVASAPDAATSSLDVEALSQELVSSPDPMALLQAFVVDVRDRAATLPGDGGLVPSSLELHLANRLEQAGLGDKGVELPALHVVRPRTSDLFYLRVDEASLSYAAKIEVMRVEAALNAALLASRLLPDANAATQAELVRSEQRVARSIVGQASRVVSRLDGEARGEWEVRYALAFGIEAFQLPWRLTARFRVNVAAHVAAFECDLVPTLAWTTTAFVDGLGVVPATAEMRRRAATDYNLRLVVLLARYAFLACPELDEVWVAGVRDSAADHRCYVSARFEREWVEGTDLEGAFDPLALLRSCDAVMDADERARTLSPVAQSFSLEDERLCPAERWDDPELSDAALSPDEAAELGCVSVSDLGIEEACLRRHVAGELIRDLSESTEKNVRLLLDVAAAAGPDEAGHALAEAARRCVGALIDGSLADNPEAIAEALVAGDALSLGAIRAQELLVAQDPSEAEACADEALRSVTPAGAFEDTDGVVWRAFGSYVERALFNRLLAHEGQEVRLAPAGYFEAELIAAVSKLAQGRADEALPHARRAVEVAPFSAQASLNLAQVLESTGRRDEAQAELCRLLSLAHDPESLGLGYLRMAQLQWQSGHVLAAQACYQRACRYLNASALVAGLAAVAILGHVGAASGGTLPPNQADAVLRAAGIPLAPAEEVATVFLEAARGAVDAEVWPVARDFMRTLGAMSRDDVYVGMLRSIEGEPDR